MKIHKNKALFLLSLLKGAELFSSATPTESQDYIKKVPPFAYAAMILLTQEKCENKYSRYSSIHGGKAFGSATVWGWDDLGIQFEGSQSFSNTTMAAVKINKFHVRSFDGYCYVFDAQAYPEIDADDKDTPRTDRIIIRDQNEFYLQYEKKAVFLGAGLGGRYASQFLAANKNFFFHFDALRALTFDSSKVVEANNQSHLISPKHRETYPEKCEPKSCFIEIPEQATVSHGELHFPPKKEISHSLEHLIEQRRFGAVMRPWSELTNN